MNSTRKRATDSNLAGWRDMTPEEVWHELERALTAEEEKDRRIATLEAELARLKPSAQLAGDEAEVRAAIRCLPGYDPEDDKAHAALSRIAAQAHGYEAAVAGNAALVDVIRITKSALDEPGAAPHRISLALGMVIIQPHLGAALLERMRAMEEVVRTLVTGWGGTLAGLAELRAKAQALIAEEAQTTTAGTKPAGIVDAVLAGRLAAMRAHAQMLYESAPSTNSKTPRDQVNAWERAKRIHHEMMAEPDPGAKLLTELNDHRRNIEVLRDELSAKDDEHVVDALHRYVEELIAIIKALAACVRSRAGHEENCRGWRRPVKDKSAPAWKRRGEWMDLTACTCGPGELLKLVSEALS